MSRVQHLDHYQKVSVVMGGTKKISMVQERYGRGTLSVQVTASAIVALS